MISCLRLLNSSWDKDLMRNDTLPPSLLHTVKPHFEVDTHSTFSIQRCLRKKYLCLKLFLNWSFRLEEKKRLELIALQVKNILDVLESFSLFKNQSQTFRFDRLAHLSNNQNWTWFTHIVWLLLKTFPANIRLLFSYLPFQDQWRNQK